MPHTQPLLLKPLTLVILTTHKFKFSHPVQDNSRNPPRNTTQTLVMTQDAVGAAVMSGPALAIGDFTIIPEHRKYINGDQMLGDSCAQEPALTSLSLS